MCSKVVAYSISGSLILTLLFITLINYADKFHSVNLTPDSANQRRSRRSLNEPEPERNPGTGTLERRLPGALIIGVKKSGTRALLEYLRIHPDVRAPGPEVHFFDRHYQRGLQWYRRQMPMSSEGQLTVEKTPSYFVTPSAPEKIFAMNPDVKILLVVRDPVTRALSEYAQVATKRPEIGSFESLAFHDDAARSVNEHWGAVKLGMYWLLLRRWLTFFPLRNIHIVHGERLITNPGAEMALVEDFLGLNRVISNEHFYFNQTKGFPCIRRVSGAAKGGQPHCLGHTKGRPHPVLATAELQRLRDYYAPHNEIFSRLVRRRFNWSS